MSGRFQNKVVVVTGGARGIGRAAAVRFGSEGARVVLGVVQPLLDYPEDTFDRVLAVNVKSVWLGLKLVAPAIIRRGGGAIVNTASIAGLRATPGLVAYTASKHAVIGLTRTASIELVRHRVRVNAVCPAPIETPMGHLLDQSFDPKDPQAAHRRFVARIPMGRYGEPEEVAALVAFLCSPTARPWPEQKPAPGQAERPIAVLRARSAR